MSATATSCRSFLRSRRRRSEANPASAIVAGSVAGTACSDSSAAAMCARSRAPPAGNRLLTCRVAAVGDVAGQCRQARFVGQCAEDRIGDLREQHVEIARQPQHPCQYGQGIAQGFAESARAAPGRTGAMRRAGDAWRRASGGCIRDLRWPMRRGGSAASAAGNQCNAAEGVGGRHRGGESDSPALTGVAVLRCGGDSRARPWTGRMVSMSPAARVALRVRISADTGAPASSSSTSDMASRRPLAMIQPRSSVSRTKAGPGRKLPGNAPEARFADGHDAREQLRASHPFAHRRWSTAEKSKWPP
jgi:hypothetical protein